MRIRACRPPTTTTAIRGASDSSLWLDDDEGGDQYPRRAAGESLKVGLTTGEGAVQLRATLLRCHSRGREGVGVYLLASPTT